MRRAVGSRVRGLVVCLVVGVSVSGCSSVSGLFGDDGPEPYEVGYVDDPYPDLEPVEGDVDELADVALLPVTSPDPVASVQGELRLRGEEGAGTVDADLDVLAVTASEQSTVLRVRVRADKPVLPADDVWDTDRMGYYFDTVTVTVKDETVLSPSFYRYAEGVFGKNCLCSELIGQVGPRGVTFYTYYGPLPEGTPEVKVTMNGFDPVVAPVEWLTP